MAADLSLPRVVTALGLVQIVSWGTLFYTIAVLGPPMRAALGVGEVMLFGSLTAGLALSGALSPLVGRTIDARGGRRVLVAGSWLSALALAGGLFSSTRDSIWPCACPCTSGPCRTGSVAALLAYRRALSAARAGWRNADTHGDDGRSD